MGRKIYISAGHSNVRGRDMGAVSEFEGKTLIEGTLMVEFRDLLNKELQKIDVCPILDKDNSILQDTINYFRKLTSKNDIVIDFHLNSSSNSSANGTETIVPNNPSPLEKKLAEEINNKIVEVLGTRNRGVKTDKSLGRKLGFFTIPGENILIEFCFLSNKSDMEKYQSNKKVLAKELAKIISKYKN